MERRLAIRLAHDAADDGDERLIGRWRLGVTAGSVKNRQGLHGKKRVSEEPRLPNAGVTRDQERTAAAVAQRRNPSTQVIDLARPTDERGCAWGPLGQV